MDRQISRNLLYVDPGETVTCPAGGRGASHLGAQIHRGPFLARVRSKVAGPCVLPEGMP